MLLPLGLYADSKSELASVRGVVLDAQTKEPMPGATVVVKGSENGQITDLDGRFVISNLEPQKSVTLVVSFIGYKSQEIAYRTSNRRGQLSESIALEVDSKMLDQVVVKGSEDISKELGDTTQYNASAYKTHPDATVQDLLEKMPAFVVEDGKVQADGEDIQYVYVDGKAYFKNDPQAALNSLPADVIANIQLFEEQSDKSRLTGVDDGQRIKAINIVTTMKKKTAALGEFIAGYGTDGHYNAKADANIFVGDHIFTVGAGLNNINQSALIGGRNYGRYGAAGIQEAAAVKFNYTGEFGEKNANNTRVGFNYILDHNNTNKESYTDQTGLIIDDEYSSLSVSESGQTNHRLSADLDVNRKGSMLILRPYATFSQSDNFSNAATSRLVDGAITNKSTTNNVSDASSYTAGTRLMWMKRLTERHSITLGGDVRLSNSTSDQVIEGSTSSLDLDSQQMIDSLINQVTNVHTGANSVSGTIAYTLNAGRGHAVSADYDLGYDWSDSDNKTYLFDPLTGEYTELFEALSNVFTRDYVTQNMSLGYSYNKENTVRLNAKVGYQISDLHNDLVYPEAKVFDYTFNNVTLSGGGEYSFTESNRLMLRYSGRPLLPSVNQLQDVLNVSNPLRASIGNPHLSTGYTNSMSLRYTASDNDKSTSFRIYASASATANGFTNNTTLIERDTVIKGVNFAAGTQLTSPVNVSGAVNTRLGISYSFPVGFISSKMNTGLYMRYSNTPSMFNGEKFFSTSQGAAFRFSINSNISENVDFTVGNYFDVSDAKSTMAGSTSDLFIREVVQLKLNWIFLKNFVFNTQYNYNYNHYSTGALEDPDFHQLNVALGYKFLKQRAEFRCSVFDLLGQSESIGRSVSDTYITDTRSMTLQRHMMFSLSYKFRSIGVPPSSEGNGRSQGGRGGGMGPARMH